MARYDPRHPVAYENQSDDSQRGWNDDEKDYSRRYGRAPEECEPHRYHDANTPYASGTGEKRIIYTTDDYDDDYLNRRLHSGR